MVCPLQAAHFIRRVSVCAQTSTMSVKGRKMRESNGGAAWTGAVAVPSLPAMPCWVAVSSTPHDEEEGRDGGTQVPTVFEAGSAGPTVTNGR